MLLQEMRSTHPGRNVARYLEVVGNLRQARRGCWPPPFHGIGRSDHVARKRPFR